MSEVGKKVKKTAFIGAGAFLQILGVVVLLGLVWIFPLGTVVALLLGPALLLKGSQMSIFWSCSRCGERLPNPAVEMCKGCKCDFTATKRVGVATKVAAVVMCGCVGLLFYILAPGDKPEVGAGGSQADTTAASAAAPSLTIGGWAQVTGRESAFVARDRSSLDELLSAVMNEDDERYKSLQDSGRVVFVHAKCRLQVLEVAAGYTRVQVLNGPHFGRSGWVRSASVSVAPPEDGLGAALALTSFEPSQTVTDGLAIGAETRTVTPSSDDAPRNSPVALTFDALEGLSRATTAKDGDSLRRLFETGQVLAVEAGSSVRILDRLEDLCMVRVLSGSHSEKLGWIQSDRLEKPGT